MKKLELVFKSSEGKNRSLMVNYASEDLSSEDVKGAMTQLANLKMFNKDGVSLYDVPQYAQYVEVKHDVVFDDRTKA